MPGDSPTGSSPSTPVTQQPETDEVDSELSKLQQRVASLDVERASLLYRIEEVTATLRMPYLGESGTLSQPRERTTRVQINTLPLEVLRTIFLHCLPHEIEAVVHPREAPLLFGQVCSLWKNVAWSAPELWVTLQVQIPAINYDPFRYENEIWNNYLATIEEWLDRSKSRPLFVSVIDLNTLHWNDIRAKLITKVLQVLSAQSTRWKSLHLCLRANLLLDTDLVPTSNRMLEALVLEMPPLDINKLPGASSGTNPYAYEDVTVKPADLGPWIRSLFISTRLRSIHVSNISLLGDPEAALPKLQWVALTRLALGCESMSGRHCLTSFDASLMLNHLARLESPLQYCYLVFTHRWTPRRANSGASRIVLSRLEDFLVTYLVPGGGFSHDYELKTLFDTIYAPSLHSFSYKITNLRSSDLPFYEFLRPISGLKVLRLIIPGISSPMSISERLACHSIEELHLSADFLQAGITPCDLARFPNLATLVLDCSLPRSRQDLYAHLYPESGPAESSSDLAIMFRNAIERMRYIALDGRIDFIKEWVRESGQKKARKVEFRLNERLRDRALRILAPLTADGLYVTFKDDYYDVPPP